MNRNMYGDQPGINPTARALASSKATDDTEHLAVIKARFQKAGHRVHDGDNNDYIVTRWNMSRHCPDMAALRLFARVVGF